LNLRQSDYLLSILAHRSRGLMRHLGGVESRWLGRKLQSIELNAPVFLTGLARSGTTILLEELARFPGVATHRYRDFPFLMTPVFWNRFTSRFAAKQEPVERPHKDRIRITAESPEAFEEPIWQFFFPEAHSPTSLHRLGADVKNEEFESFFRDHIRKVLLLRSGRRYLSKENYNVSRIEYLGRIFPDSRFLIPVRHPVDHVHSLVRQHRLFCDYDRQDRRVRSYLAMAGHYEFGPQRCPIRLDGDSGDRAFAAWQKGADYRGYAIQWAAIYRLIHQLCSREDGLSRRILVVRYEDFCATPHEVMRRILAHIDLPPRALPPDACSHISPPERSSEPASDSQKEIWQETRDCAACFGYVPSNGPHMPAFTGSRVQSTRL